MSYGVSLASGSRFKQIGGPKATCGSNLPSTSDLAIRRESRTYSGHIGLLNTNRKYLRFDLWLVSPASLRVSGSPAYRRIISPILAEILTDSGILHHARSLRADIMPGPRGNRWQSAPWGRIIASCSHLFPWPDTWQCRLGAKPLLCSTAELQRP